MVFHDEVELAVVRQPVQRVPAGSLVLWSPAQRPAWYGQRRRPWSHSWITCSGTWWERLLGESGLPLLRPVPLPGQSAAVCLGGLHRELTQAEPEPEILLAHLRILMCEARRNQRQAPQAEPEDRLLWSRNHLDAHLDRPVQLAELAMHLGLSTRQLVRRFTAAWGMSPSEYHLQARMTHAATQLQRPELTLAAVSELVGYADAFAFSKAFKRWSGSSPAVWRRQASAPQRSRRR
jgi:AraC family transcriptional regulator of arabinose operon